MTKHSMFVYAIVFSFFPLIANADIDVRNNTKGYGTAKTKYSPCSSIAGDGGIIAPNSSLKIPQYILKTYCAWGCNVYVYMSKNCSGKNIATLDVHPKNGIRGVNNHNVDNYIVSGAGMSGFINGGPLKNIFDFLSTYG